VLKRFTDTCSKEDENGQPIYLGHHRMPISQSCDRAERLQSQTSIIHSFYRRSWLIRDGRLVKSTGISDMVLHQYCRILPIIWFQEFLLINYSIMMVIGPKRIRGTPWLFQHPLQNRLRRFRSSQQLPR